MPQGSQPVSRLVDSTHPDTLMSKSVVEFFLVPPRHVRQTHLLSSTSRHELINDCPVLRPVDYLYSRISEKPRPVLGKLVLTMGLTRRSLGLDQRRR